MMIRKQIFRPTMVIGAHAVLSACASVPDAKSPKVSPVGAWASGSDISLCETAPITYFSSDGVVVVLLSAEGPVHSIGSWDSKVDILSMTHNDFPLDPVGQSKPAIDLDIVELTSDRFVTRNAKGDVRERIKCRDVEINPNPDHVSYR